MKEITCKESKREKKILYHLTRSRGCPINPFHHFFLKI